MGKEQPTTVSLQDLLEGTAENLSPAAAYADQFDPPLTANETVVLAPVITVHLENAERAAHEITDFRHGITYSEWRDYVRANPYRDNLQRPRLFYELNVPIQIAQLSHSVLSKLDSMSDNELSQAFCDFATRAHLRPAIEEIEIGRLEYEHDHPAYQRRLHSLKSLETALRRLRDPYDMRLIYDPYNRQFIEYQKAEQPQPLIESDISSVDIEIAALLDQARIEFEIGQGLIGPEKLQADYATAGSLALNEAWEQVEKALAPEATEDDKPRDDLWLEDAWLEAPAPVASDLFDDRGSRYVLDAISSGDERNVEAIIGEAQTKGYEFNNEQRALAVAFGQTITVHGAKGKWQEIRTKVFGAPSATNQEKLATIREYNQQMAYAAELMLQNKATNRKLQAHVQVVEYIQSLPASERSAELIRLRDRFHSAFNEGRMPR